MDAMKQDHSIEALCESLDVSRSGYYAWRHRRDHPGQRAQEDARIADDIARIFDQSRRTYGSPRISACLRSEGRRHGRGRIARLMRSKGLRGRQKARYRVQTTDSNHDHPIAPNRLAQMPPPQRPNEVWVADITYIQTTHDHWLYLAAVMDLCSRRIVGWAMGPSIDTRLVQDALAMACTHRRPPEGLVFHSDRGVQYASGDFRASLQKARLVPSMSRKGNCCDNAAKGPSDPPSSTSWCTALTSSTTPRLRYRSSTTSPGSITPAVSTAPSATSPLPTSRPLFNAKNHPFYCPLFRGKPIPFSMWSLPPTFSSHCLASPELFVTGAGSARRRAELCQNHETSHSRETRRSTMGLEPVGAEAKRTLGRGLHRAIGAPSVVVADGERVEVGHFLPSRINPQRHNL